MPPADQVRDALERVLTSECFARSERSRKLLRYLVEQDLAGNGERLKGFSIAVDVFGKSDSFDPATDTVVRVQAGRLRDLLEQYHAGEGRDAPLRIAVPRGSYVPDYRQGEPDCQATAHPIPGEDRSPRYPGIRALGYLAAGIVLVAVMAGAALWNEFAPPPAAVGGEVAMTADAGAAVDDTGTTGSVPREMLPSVYLAVAPGEYGGDRVASALHRGLTAFDTVHFIARSPPAEMLVRRATDFVFTVAEDGRPGNVHLELHNVMTGKVLLSRSMPVAGRFQDAIDDDIADLLTSVVPASGIIYANLEESRAATALTGCLALNDRFYRDQNAAAHREAYKCLEGLAASDVNSALVYAELASLHVQAFVSGYRHPPDPSPQQALVYARKAVQLAPHSPSAHRSMGYVLSRTAAGEESLRWTRRAYELNTFDLGMAASYGYALIFDGAYRDGTRILERAVAAASSHPTWWDYGLFLGHFMLGDGQGAAGAVSALASSGRAHYVAARALAADALGAHDEAAELLAQLEQSHPSFIADPEAFFRRGNYPQDLTERLVDALRVARLRNAS